MRKLLSIDKEQAQGYCSSGMDPSGYRQREQPKARAQTVLMHSQHIHQVISKEEMSSATVEATGFPLVLNSLNPSLGEVRKRGDGNERGFTEAT